ncbi:NAD(P)-dependent oxidoreductase [Rhizobium sp. EC-SD404]|uniref:NAD(P)-dependent oxidoreductase n=1 Tax=Rhizobium sp. EC-SD404 TaxID=2038389 RepID=UPI00125506F2|nr:NAD(P)-dependent oxidoreductase [Rhizobium sp. EC-SD404]VVT08145.1 2-hydroxy-3-oxopropionate reductase [Rhizobium sp. EC-SD404]
MTSRHIAFLGTGLMGAPMATNLLKAGHRLTVWNRSKEKAEPLGKLGADIAASAADAVKEADIVVTIVSNGEAVADLLFAQGVAAAMKSGAIFIDMSSITPAEARDHAAKLQAMGLRHLDAPVSGGTKGAEAATLAIMAGGEEETFDDAAPVLKALGRPVRVGASGTGQLAKLANQAIVGITIGAVAEATLLVQSGGGNAEAFRDALKGGFADSAILQLHGWRMDSRDFTPGAKSSIQLKDMNNIVKEADALAIELPLAHSIRERYETLVHAMNEPDLDHAALYLELIGRAKS